MGNTTPPEPETPEARLDRITGELVEHAIAKVTNDYDPKLKYHNSDHTKFVLARSEQILTHPKTQAK